jgi:hypothetical protein
VWLAFLRTILALRRQSLKPSGCRNAMPTKGAKRSRWFSMVRLFLSEFHPSFNVMLPGQTGIFMVVVARYMMEKRTGQAQSLQAVWNW